MVVREKEAFGHGAVATTCLRLAERDCRPCHLGPLRGSPGGGCVGGGRVALGGGEERDGDRRSAVVHQGLHRLHTEQAQAVCAVFLKVPPNVHERRVPRQCLF